MPSEIGVITPDTETTATSFLLDANVQFCASILYFSPSSRVIAVGIAEPPDVVVVVVTTVVVVVVVTVVVVTGGSSMPDMSILNASISPSVRRRFMIPFSLSVSFIGSVYLSVLITALSLSSVCTKV